MTEARTSEEHALQSATLERARSEAEALLSRKVIADAEREARDIAVQHAQKLADEAVIVELRRDAERRALEASVVRTEEEARKAEEAEAQADALARRTWSWFGLKNSRSALVE
jgi:hypothetical protein